jgi:hypothetical protein
MTEFSGWITKEGGTMIRNWKRRWAIVSSKTGTLSYFKDSVNISKELGRIVVKGCKLSYVPKEVKKKKFCICISDKEDDFYFTLDSKEEMIEWMNVLESINSGATMISEEPQVIDIGKLQLLTGWILKFSNSTDTWRRLWAVLDSNEIRCFKVKNFFIFYFFDKFFFFFFC